MDALVSFYKKQSAYTIVKVDMLWCFTQYTKWQNLVACNVNMINELLV